MPPTQLNPTNAEKVDQFVPPPYAQPHVRRQLDEVLQGVADVIPPVWPLKDYVAVNPFAGVSHRSFADARAFLKVFSDCETLMPLSYFAEQLKRGQFGAIEIDEAIAELESAGSLLSADWSADTIIDRLSDALDVTQADSDAPSDTVGNPSRRIRTIAEQVDRHCDVSWSEAIIDEISKHCAAHYDDGQATWSQPGKDLSLYQAWRQLAEHDRNLEILGLSGLRKLVSQLPHSPDAAIVDLLQRLDIPESLWESFLLCQAFSIPGWSAWTKYQSDWRTCTESANEDFVGLIAMRLAYDVAVGKAFGVQINWHSIAGNLNPSFKTPVGNEADGTKMRMILLRASEIAYRSQVLGQLSVTAVDHQPAHTNRRLAQMVFCIDVRSERIRRQLEAVSSEIETFGFAGFFGMPIEFVALGQNQGDAHVPVLLKPEFQLTEGIANDEGKTDERIALSKLQVTRSWRSLWKGFQSSAVGCFSFVESAGLLYGWKLLSRAIGFGNSVQKSCRHGSHDDVHANLGPTLKGLNEQGISQERQVDLAHGLLKNLGLTDEFARLVVFCGHTSQTENNPLAASLDCGACGGHSGEPNARLAAMLLNQPAIRRSLGERGIVIPVDTHFVAAVHNTTTDALEYFDLDAVPETHQGDVADLVQHSATASLQTLHERTPIVARGSLNELVGGAADWSEVRPEWGLAGNASFIIAPRSLTKQVNLDGRSFLHSYDYRTDPEGKVLETIMTAPMIVAHWINMQYYASCVDNRNFGSGNKTVHNVVGRFGILSGNAGDLMTGLPWQSLHSGQAFQHHPMRLQVVIAAPRSSIETIVSAHELVANLVGGGWLHLIAIDDGQAFRLSENGHWELIPGGVSPHAAADPKVQQPV